MMASAAADGAGVGITGCTPELMGSINNVAQYVVKTAGCAVKTRYPSVPHPSSQSNEAEQGLR